MQRVTMQTVFNEGQKQPGRDLEKLDWERFAEIQLANDSDVPTTVDAAEVRVRAGHKPQITLWELLHIRDFG